MNIFVTGTESFVGKELIHQCDKKGIEVFGCDMLEPSDSRFSKMDINSENLADIIPEQADAIIHLAALSTDNQCKENVHECYKTNVLGTLNLMRCTQKKKAKQFIFASTEWVYDSFKDDELKDERSVINIQNLSSEYAISKLVSESNLKQQYERGFCPVTILRFGIIYGPREKGGSAVESLLSAVKQLEEITVGSRKTGRCFIHVSDISRGIIEAIGLDGFNTLNLQGKKLITLGDIIETSGKILGKKPIIIEKDPANPNIRKVSNIKAKQMISWQPEMDLESGLEDLLSSSVF